MFEKPEARIALPIFIILSLFLTYSTTAIAATFNPTTTQELIDDITTANSNGVTDTINLVPGMTYTITGAETGVPFNDGTNGNNGLPIILSDSSNSITINGNGATIERDTALFTSTPCSGLLLKFRILQINANAGVTINNLTMLNGCAGINGANPIEGGGILNFGVLDFNGSTLANNESLETGGGISNYNDFDTSGSTILGNIASIRGGGIWNSMDIDIQNSAILSNQAFLGNPISSGGGIFSLSGIVSITNSTVSGNVATVDGGGIRTDEIQQTFVLLTNVTITDNTAGTDGGGLKFGLGTPTRIIMNSLIVDNTAPADPNCASTLAISDMGNNISDNNTDDCAFAFNASWNNATMIVPLQDNGGGTLTHELLVTVAPANPAIDFVPTLSCAGITNDQRFFPRPTTTACDAGAFELQDTGSITIAKETNPDGGTGFGFTGTGFPDGCPLNGAFSLDDIGLLTCILPLASYTVTETSFGGFNLADINCTGAVSFSETSTSATVNLASGEAVTCTFTNNEITLNQLTPSQAGILNTVSSTDSTPNGNVSYIYSFNLVSPLTAGLSSFDDPGISLSAFSASTKVAPDDVCPGLQTPLVNPRILATVQADGSGDSSHDFTISENAAGVTVFIQAVDITECAGSNVNEETITDPTPLTLQPLNPGTADTLNTTTAINATPTGNVTIIWGFVQQAGIDGSSLCPGLQVDILNFRTLFTLIADGSGTASGNVFVPANASGITIFMQAVDLTMCAPSNVNQEDF